MPRARDPRKEAPEWTPPETSMFQDRLYPLASVLVVIVSVAALALPAIVAAKQAVDPATLTPPPPPDFNPTCERVGNQIICEVVFTDPAIVDEPSGVVCSGTELLFSRTRSVVGKRFYDAEGLLLRRHFHDDVSGTNPVTGATASFSGGSMTLHDLAVLGDSGSGISRISGSVRIYLPDGGTISHQDAGHLSRRGDGNGPLTERAAPVRGLLRKRRHDSTRRVVQRPRLGPCVHDHEAVRRPMAGET